jgi:DNA end-binding protein Ku
MVALVRGLDGFDLYKQLANPISESESAKESTVARPFWSGQLRISLVSFGVNLIPATEAKGEIRFHQLDRRTGERVRHQKVSSADEEPVEKGDIVKGYEYSKGEFIQLEPAEIEQLRIASSHLIELEQFVNADEIGPEFYEKPYFVLPENSAQAEAFAVVRKALEEKKRIGLGKVALGGRERLVAVTAPNDPKLRGMMAYTLRFSAELRNAAQYFEDIKEHKIDHDQLALAKQLIERKSTPFEPDKFTDNYEAALRELIDAKLKHVALPKQQDREVRGKVINLMDALRRSVGEQTGKKKPVVRADGTTGRGRAGKQGLGLVRSNSRGAEKRPKSA